MGNIESQGIGYLTSIIARSNYLDPHFSINDRTQSWDGNIFVYSDETQAKKFLQGTIPVQIKCKVTTNLDTSETSFPFEVDDIKNYYRERGVILFLIEISPIGYNIFYKTCWASDLKNILDSIKRVNQKTKSVALQKFDSIQLSNFEMDCREFLLHRKFQFSTIDYPLSIDQATELIIPIPANLPNPYHYIFSHELGLYGKQSHSDINRFVDKIRVFEFTETVMETVSINGKEYYREFEKRTKRDEVIYKCGQDILLGNNGFQFNIVGTLLEQLHDIDFVLDLLAFNSAQFGSVSMAFSNISKKDELETQFSAHKKSLADIKFIFELFNIPAEEIILDKLDDQSSTNLKFLINFFIYHKNTGIYQMKRGFTTIKIGNKNICLFAVNSNADDENLIHLFNPYRPLSDLNLKFIQEDGSYININPYVFLTKDILLSVGNFDLDMIVDDIRKNEISDGYLSLVNLFGLELIKAYDSTKNNQYLESAQQVFQWLNVLESNNTVYYINLLQISRRQGELSSKERLSLRQKMNKEKTTKFKCGLSIMLENRTDAEEYFKLLSKEEQNEFVDFPIYTLAKDLGMFKD